MTLASKSDLKAVLFKLSKNKTGPPSINSAAMRFSTSSVFVPAVTACGSRQKEMMQVQRASIPFPVPVPDRDGARIKTPGARSRLGRHMAVIEAARSERLVHTGRLAYVDERRLCYRTPPIVSASAKQKVAKVLRICARAAAA